MSKMMKFSILILMSLTLIQCGKKGDDYSSKLLITMPNSQPLVRVTPRTVGLSEISANWFDAYFMIQNVGDRAVRLEEILFYVTIDGVETGPYSFDLGILSLYDESTGATYFFTDYCTYQPGEPAVKLTACSTANLDGNPLPTGTHPETQAKALTLYIGALPKPQVPTLLAFPVRVEFHGVVLNADNTDADRFFKTVNFTTR